MIRWAWGIAAIAVLSALMGMNYVSENYYSKCDSDTHAQRFVEAELSCSAAVHWTRRMEWLIPGRYTRALTYAGVAELTMSRLAASREHLQLALDRYENLNLGDSLDRAEVMDHFSVLNYHEGKFKEGVQWSRRSLEMFDRQGDPCEDRRLGAILDLELNLRAGGEKASAFDFLKANESSILRCTENVARVGVFLRVMGSAQDAEGEPDEALKSYDLAIEKLAATFTSGTVQHAFALIGRARVYNQLADVESARVDIAAAIPMLDKGLGPNSESHAYALFVRADGFRLEKRLDEAAEEYAKVERILAKVVGKRHPSYGVLLRSQAGVLSDAGQYEQAIAKAQQALHIRVENFGEHDEIAKAIRNEIAELTRLKRGRIH